MNGSLGWLPPGGGSSTRGGGQERIDLPPYLRDMAAGLVLVDDALGCCPVDDGNGLVQERFQLLGILLFEGLFEHLQGGSQRGANVSVSDSFLVVLANPLFR